MSYSLIGHFVDVKNKKRIVSADLGFMKNLNERRYSAEFEGITATGKTKDEDYPEITEYTYTVFQGYYLRDILSEPKFKDKFIKKNTTHREGAEGYVCDKDFIKENEDLFHKYEFQPSLEEMVNGGSDDFNGKTVLLYYRETKKNTGTWFKPSDFTGSEEKFKKEYEEKKSRVDKLKSLKDTKEWFEMSEDGRNNCLEEINCAEEDLQDAEWKYWSIQKMNHIIDFIYEDVGFPYKDETGSTRYMWNCDDNREIEIYIEVD